jgi:hypothetical protein
MKCWLALAVMMGTGCPTAIVGPDLHDAGSNVDAGSRTDAGDPDGGVDLPDAGVDAGVGAGVDAGVIDPTQGACATAVAVATYFNEQRCTSCHAGPGTTFPDLRYAALAQLIDAESLRRPGQRLVVPGQAENSELFLRIAGPEPADYPTGWWMPTGTVGPHDATAVAAWIAADAELVCDDDGVVPPPPPIITNPNDYDPALLFACADPLVPSSSPARLRRINDIEFSLAAANPIDGPRSDTVRNNPLAIGSRYSTQSGLAGMDDTTLGLLMLTVPSSSRPWLTRAQPSSVGGRFWTSYDGLLGNNVFTGTPTPVERDRWVDLLLRQGVLFRSPTIEEQSALRALLDDLLMEESGAEDRVATLTTVTSAAQLMAGALFRSEMGEGPSDGDLRLLSAEELGLAIGRVIAANPVSSTLFGAVPDDLQGHPDWSRPTRIDGRLAEVRDAVNDGTIHDPAVIQRLLGRYLGGIDPLRLDVSTDEAAIGDHDAIRRERGEYWLSEGLRSFFREWLEAGNAEAVFKEVPNATSRWPEHDNMVNTGYTLITSPFRRETLLPLLDDTIARAVIETQNNGGDVFRALLTTRMFRVTSNRAAITLPPQTSAVPCTTDATCVRGSCDTVLGFCADFAVTEKNRVFDLDDDVQNRQADRWVTMPADQRAGVLTHPAFLAAHGGNFEDDASIVLRGRWIRENLLCNDVPGLELVSVSAMLGPHDPALRARDRVSAATEAPGSECINCHREMNPYGYPFEIYNHAGFMRSDDHGQAPSGFSRIDEPDDQAPDPSINHRDYADAIALTEALADSPVARRCFIRNVFRFFMARDERPADACTLTRMEDAFAGGSLFAMIESLVTSDAFLYRSDEGGGP